MQQSCTYGSVRGAPENRRPYRDKTTCVTAPWPSRLCKSSRISGCFLSRAGKQAVLRVFQQPVSTTGS